MRTRGFTLVELLAVLVVLSIILAIAVPNITKVIKDSSKSAFESNAKIVINTIDSKIGLNEITDLSNIDATNAPDLLGVDANNIQEITVSKVGGKPYIVILGKNKWEGLVSYGTYTDIKVSDSNNYELIKSHVGFNETKGANEPKLATGMTPIKWNGSMWVNTSEADTDWYNYDITNKIWANAQTADGSMWVWIPRYIYKIGSGWHTSTAGTIDIQFTKGIDDNWNQATIGVINTDNSANASNNKWTNHPAFTFGSAELTGIWVAKFEAASAEGVVNGFTSDQSCPIAGDNLSTKTIKIIPNVRSWRCIQVDAAFIASRNMETNPFYGWGTTGSGIDSHMIKNSEWGAVTYLSKSQYGKNNEEIYINNNQSFVTGCSGSSATDGAYNGCKNTYETLNGGKASTTGNIYGIYDMSGGAAEYVAAYVNNGNGDLLQGSNILGAQNKYKDIYAVGTPDSAENNYNLTINYKGDAVYETSNNNSAISTWFNRTSIIPGGINPWFLRGGAYNFTTNTGPFSFTYYWGGPGNSYGFRPALAVGSGL